jgi:hypothetical protein
MKRWSSVLVLLLLIAAPCFGQRANASVNAEGGLPRDTRPFGKYLVEICTVSGQERTITCHVMPHLPNSALPLAPPNCAERKNLACYPDALVQKTGQTITLKLACDPKSKATCEGPNPKVGDDFFVSATTDSGLPVRQTVRLGNAIALDGNRTIRYLASTEGPIIIRATADGNSIYAEAPPVDLVIQVGSESASTSEPCLVLPPSQPGTQSAFLDAVTIISLLGNPTPFILAAQGPNTILVYSTRANLSDVELRILGSIQPALVELAGRTTVGLSITPQPAKPFTVELTIPHASALGDPAARLSGLNYSQFTIQDVTRNSVRITAPTQPDCATWKGFLSDIREMTWQLVSDPMSEKLFYLSSSDIATAFSGLSPAAPAATPAPASTPNSSAAATTPPAPSAPSSTPTPTAAPPAAASSTPAGAAPATTATPQVSSAATIAITQPPGSNIQINSDTTPCVIAGLAFSNGAACGGAPAAASAVAPSSATTPSAPPAALAMASVAVAAGITEQTPPDLLVYSDTNPGDDAQIEERNRVIAQLDLPRPEMILTAWVTQDSSVSPQAIGAFNNMVKSLVADYDQQFEKLVLDGWRSVKRQSDEPGYFNEPFRSYIEDRFVADTFKARKEGGTIQELSQAYLDRSQARLSEHQSPTARATLRACESSRYCLGYNSLFHPLKPALTDLLLTIIAAQQPLVVAENAIRDIEGSPGLLDLQAKESVCDTVDANEKDKEFEAKRRCQAIWRTLDLDRSVSPPGGPQNCAERDLRGIIDSIRHYSEPVVRLQCFKEEAEQLLAPDPASGTAYGAGLLRAAIADFLFNYKMSQQYPHEFIPYDLSHSADALNNALTPLIDAFNRDLWSYQLFVRADMQYRVERINATTDGRCCVKRLFGLDKPSFFNDGLVTVRTISGQSTNVSTTSQSYLNASSAPQLSSLLSSLAGLGGAAGAAPPATSTSGTTTTTTTTTTSGGSAAAGGSGPPTGPGNFAAISAALANYQSTYAQIGRQLSFSATPRSLAAASSAEIAVTLNADESAGGPIYTGGGTSDPSTNTSRVANHDTTTRVRVDSIKLFEVSSFSAIVERSHSRFPLLPPFVEIPYIGTLAGIPLGSAKEFHSSTAIISAYVVPTAADVAYGLRFVSDLVVDGLNPGPCSFYRDAASLDETDVCIFRKMLSLRDVVVKGQNIREFNKNMIRCLATDTTTKGCLSTSFDSTIQSR